VSLLGCVCVCCVFVCLCDVYMFFCVVSLTKHMCVRSVACTLCPALSPVAFHVPSKVCFMKEW
jgi:hypothetical protein